MIGIVDAISEELRDKLFPKAAPGDETSGLERYRVRQAVGEFLGEEFKALPVNFPEPDCPKMPKGPVAWVENAAEKMLGQQWRSLRELAASPLPPAPDSFLELAGWVRYGPDGSSKPVESPEELVTVADVETYASVDGYPLMAVAASLEAWYVWLHPALVEDRQYFPQFVPLKTGSSIIAHNGMFDAGRFEPYYDVENPRPLTVLDTKSLHQATNGIGGSKQLPLFRSIEKRVKRNSSGYKPSWFTRCCPGDLVSCYKFHCRKAWDTGEGLGKELRNIFRDSRSLDPIRENLVTLIRYNVKDVAKTHELAKVLLPKFVAHTPSRMNHAALLLLSTSILKVEDWEFHAAMAVSQFEAGEREIAGALADLANEAIARWEQGENFDDDPWLSQLDWGKVSKGQYEGKPRWFYKAKGLDGLSLAMNVSPLLARLQWNGCPLVYDKSKKWGYVDGGKWRRVPHKDGVGANCGDPWGKDYLPFADNGTLSTEAGGGRAKELMENSRKISYWRSFASRILYKQFPVNNGFICPQTSVIGTSSGREKEGYWLTASSTKENRIGTEMAALTRPLKPNHVFVGADASTLEYRLAAMAGDSQGYSELGGINLGVCSTPMAMVAFNGNKRDKTDAHSLEAAFLKLARQVAKMFNFQRIYGAGIKAISDALRAFDMTISVDEAKAKAKQSLSRNKGRKKDKTTYEGGLESSFHTFATRFAETPLARLPISRRLMPQTQDKAYDDQGDFFTSRLNYVIQATGVDFLHILVLVTSYLAELNDVEHRFTLARHDELWYSVEKGKVKEFAACMNFAHMMAYAAWSEALELNHLPKGAIAFDEINVDGTMRKEVTDRTTTAFGGGVAIPDGYYITPEELADIKIKT